MFTRSAKRHLRLQSVLMDEKERDKLKKYLQQTRPDKLKAFNVWIALHELNEKYEQGETPQPSEDLIETIEEHPTIELEDLTIKENRQKTMQQYCEELNVAVFREFLQQK